METSFIEKLTERGLTVNQFFEILNELPEDQSSIFKLSQKSYNEYKALYKELEYSYQLSSDKKNNQRKGKALESISCFLLSHSRYFCIYKNIRSSTNEYDIIVMKSESGEHLHMLDLIDSKFLCECKNHNDKVSVTYTGKFYSIVDVIKSKFGIIFSYNGLSGKSWSDSVGLLKKIYLLRGIVIISIDHNDFRRINENNDSLFLIIKEKITNLECDTHIQYDIDSLANDIKSGNVTIS